MRCVVVGLSLTPLRPDDQVNTDRRDALRQVKLLRPSEPARAWVASEEEEPLRDLVRDREGAKRDLARAPPRADELSGAAGVSAAECPWPR